MAAVVRILALVVLAWSGVAGAVDVPIKADTLFLKIVIDDRGHHAKRPNRVRFAIADPAVAKGAGTDPSAIRAGLYVAYNGGAGVFGTPDGPWDGTAGWRTNAARRARYQNRSAASGKPTTISSLRIDAGRRVKLAALSVGDLPLNPLANGDPSGPLTTVFWIRNGNERLRFCTEFPANRISVVSSTKVYGFRLVASHGKPTACPAPVALRMEPVAQGDYFAMPWPNDVRRHPDGTIDVDGWPGSDNALVAQVLAAGSAATTAFGTNAATFFQATGPLDRTTFPSSVPTPAGDATVVLADLDAQQARPILVDFKVEGRQYRPPNLLAVLPYPGHPLTGTTRHAAIVFDGVADATGMPVQPAPLLAALDAAWTPANPVPQATWDALRLQRDEVFAWVDQHTTWTHDHVAAFTVFGTQDVAREMDSVAAAVMALPPPTPISRTAGSCGPGVARTTVTGTLGLPMWQAGTRPYLNAADGGGIVIAGGAAVQQGTETVAFEMTFPCGASPASGWPILLYMDGTGASAHSTGIAELGDADPLPYVVASIAPLFGGDRQVPNSPVPIEILFFNYLNPLAGRTNQLQQAADMLYLRRVVTGLTLSAAEAGAAGPVGTDHERVVIAGHSQGALTIPLVLAVDPAVRAAFVSAGGAGFYHSLVHRADTRLLIDQLLGSTELDAFHPLAHVLQTVAEVGDAANYAGRTHGAHVLATAGVLDGCSPLEVTTHLGTALGLDLANPLHHPVFGAGALEPGVITLPATANRDGGRTGVIVQLNTGHFGAQANPMLGRSFVDTFATAGTPVVEAGPLFDDPEPGCQGRADPLAGG